MFQGVTRSPAKGLVADLLPFQVEGVSWMYHQEVHKPEIRGGILADEMGMVRNGDDDGGGDDDDDGCCGTLVDEKVNG